MGGKVEAKNCEAEMSGTGIPVVSPCGLQVLVMTARKVIHCGIANKLILSRYVYIIQCTYIKVNQKFDNH